MSRIITFLIILVLNSCGKKQANNRPIEHKNSQSAGAFEAYSVSANPIMVLNYHVSVQMESKEPCTGEITLELMSNFSLNFPKGMDQNNLLCFGIIPIPLGLVLSGVSGGIIPDTKNEQGSKVSILSKASHDGKILYLSDLGSSKFDPPRPMLLGPVVTDRAKYNGLQKSVQTIKSFDGETDKGNISVKVLSTNGTYKSPVKDGNNFDELLIWEMKSSGFQSSSLKGLTIPKITWYWKTEPILIPHLSIELSSSDLMPKKGIGGVLGGITDSFLGKIRIDLHVLDYSKM